MNGAILTYLLGFVCVWAAVALWCAAMAWLRHFTHDWDRAFQRELERDEVLVASCQSRAGGSRPSG
jgi:hypothetical protein